MDDDAARGSTGSRRGVRRSPRILHVDDSAQTRDPIARLLSADGYSVPPPVSPLSTARSAQKLLDHLDEERPDLLLINVCLEAAVDGLTLLRRARARRPDVPVVLYTQSGSQHEEADALRLGACDYIVLRGQPADALVVRNAVRTALGGLRLAQAASSPSRVVDRFVAASPEMGALVRRIHRVAADESRVLIMGETGTGKELVARAIHAGSAREAGPLVAVNCGAMPSALAQAAFFGASRGAYTGADADRRGFIEQAGGGTLFLDELGELHEDLQPLLLRFLERGEFGRVGEPATRRADVRVIAATNRDLRSELRDRKFRPDLFYRFPRPLWLPPLRERPADIDAYVRVWCETMNGHAQPFQVTAAALERLRAHAWPGNLRELRSVLECASELAFGRTIDRPQVDQAIREVDWRPHEERAPAAAAARVSAGSLGTDDEHARIRAVLEENQWNRKRAAASLGKSRWWLWRRIKQFGIGE